MALAAIRSGARSSVSQAVVVRPMTVALVARAEMAAMALAAVAAVAEPLAAAVVTVAAGL